MTKYTKTTIEQLKDLKALSKMVTKRIDEMLKSKFIDSYCDNNYSSVVRLSIEFNKEIQKLKLLKGYGMYIN